MNSKDDKYYGLSIDNSFVNLEIHKNCEEMIRFEDNKNEIDISIHNTENTFSLNTEQIIALINFLNKWINRQNEELISTINKLEEKISKVVENK